jgi:Arc/MetJ-type ribon-helix-helix transcriptional regulator
MKTIITQMLNNHEKSDLKCKVKRLSLDIPSSIWDKIVKKVESGEYKTYSSVIIDALRKQLQNHD